MSSAREEALTDQRLDDLERFRDVDFKTWQDGIERRMKEAFPNGDHVGHCRYHELQIERIGELRRLRAAVLEKSIAGLVWGFLVFVALAAWTYLKSEIRK